MILTNLFFFITMENTLHFQYPDFLIKVMIVEEFLKPKLQISKIVPPTLVRTMDLVSQNLQVMFIPGNCTVLYDSTLPWIHSFFLKYFALFFLDNILLFFQIKKD